ncbi:MAG: carbohydrate ABC transporter permease [Planctomycetaceae bacterium]|uniref:carbohydrate ABC transporter permease n=1 Tax=Lacipirellula limnantheis TaxID=2528024 RepID=UPI001A437BD2|nr:carbohydrate ABC transporter permease [Lacipirellula limnantheis]MBL9162357.1 carbohydrate ABC transporter permease [Planctomycetaceae bacterium]
MAISLAITSFALLLNAMAGYAFAKLRFVGREQVFRTLLAALVMPLQVGMLPLFLMLKQLGLINTYWAVIIPSMATIYGIFMVRQYALAIPDSLLDAARLDGASEWRLFFTIVLPLLRPVLATLGIFTFLSAWNDFMWPLIVLTGSENYTLPVALAILSTEHVQDAELMMAGSLITILPVLCLFILLQRQLIGGIMVGGVKG